ncbi:hypothetical protein D9756_010654 [Leucocoprinus leucothites]|uniref:Uncharacterized protein n=1 Tax=Leucocoprinus leucothites TaxID=201217 RepID=A0A8H5CU12_9AGAR|nr:hypothetical protein D9756_010654 [Leucoagaricus leucothites]
MQGAAVEASGDDEDEVLTGFKEDSSFDGGAMDENEIRAESDDNEEDEDEEMGPYEEQDNEDDDMDSDTTRNRYHRFLSDAIPTAAFKEKRILAERAEEVEAHLIYTKRCYRQTLASTARLVSSQAAVPPAHINSFLDRSLALKGGRSISGKGWEHRPGNIGIL